MTQAPNRFETVAYVYSQPELAILLSLFEHQGIFVLPVTRGHISVEWGLTVALGGVEIRVPAASAAAARSLVAGIDRAPFRGGVFTDNRLLDIALTIAVALLCLIPPPARIPACFVLEPRATVRRALIP